MDAKAAGNQQVHNSWRSLYLFAGDDLHAEYGPHSLHKASLLLSCQNFVLRYVSCTIKFVVWKSQYRPTTMYHYCLTWGVSGRLVYSEG